MADDNKVLVTEKSYEINKSEFLDLNHLNMEDSWYYRAAHFLDTMRLIPRLLMICYGYVFWHTTQWFMAHPDPTNAQAAFVSTIVGAGAAWFGLYVNSTGRMNPPPAKKKDK